MSYEGSATVTVGSGILAPDDVAGWTAWHAKHLGQKVQVKLSRWRKQRSLEANAYYWAVVVPVFSEATGYEKDEAHDCLKCLFLREEKVLPGGEIVERVRSTTELDSKEFGEYVERCCRWLAEHQWYVPMPSHLSEGAP